MGIVPKNLTVRFLEKKSLPPNRKERSYFQLGVQLEKAISKGNNLKNAFLT
jgi:hypothetical protein